MATEIDKEEDRLRYVSVAVSFGDREALKRYGSGVMDLACPECGAEGRRWGNPGEDLRFEGFEPVTKGGMGFILCECAKCGEHVTLPHRPA
jgi:hypothetical protein